MSNHMVGARSQLVVCEIMVLKYPTNQSIMIKLYLVVDHMLQLNTLTLTAEAGIFRLIVLVGIPSGYNTE